MRNGEEKHALITVRKFSLCGVTLRISTADELVCSIFDGGLFIKENNILCSFN